MSVVFILLPLALLLGLFFLSGFLKVASEGQYDDLETPAHRMLLEDEVIHKTANQPRKSTEVRR